VLFLFYHREKIKKSRSSVHSLRSDFSALKKNENLFPYPGNRLSALAFSENGL
jgi:hypothetical protein